MKNVDLIYDILDKAAHIYYDNLKLDYLSALTEINNNLNYDEYHTILSDEVIKNLEFIYKPFLEGSFLNEEIRLALELYTVKGLKHNNYPPTVMLPDFINYLYVMIVNNLFSGNISIMDTNLGTANLLAAINNNYPGNANLIGIEEDELLLKYASAFMSLQQTPIKIYYQSLLGKVLDVVDLVVGELRSFYLDDSLNLDNKLHNENVRYFPYLAITSRIENILDNGYFIYLVDNDFFKNKDFLLFNKHLNEYAYIAGIVMLPPEIVKNKEVGKSIIIGKKSKNIREILAVDIKGVKKELVVEATKKIKLMIEKIKED